MLGVSGAVFQAILLNPLADSYTLGISTGAAPTIQELLRETNTIGSKANNAQIARHVVQIKTNIERLREMISYGHR